jgi:hypothetical protein
MLRKAAAATVLVATVAYALRPTPLREYVEKNKAAFAMAQEKKIGFHYDSLPEVYYTNFLDDRFGEQYGDIIIIHSVYAATPDDYLKRLWNFLMYGGDQNVDGTLHHEMAHNYILHNISPPRSMSGRESRLNEAVAYWVDTYLFLRDPTFVMACTVSPVLDRYGGFALKDLFEDPPTYPDFMNPERYRERINKRLEKTWKERGLAPAK